MPNGTRPTNVTKAVIPNWYLYGPAGDVLQQESFPRVDFSGVEELFSGNHQWPPPKGAPLQNYGGPFSVRKRTTIHTPAYLDAFTLPWGSPQKGQVYRGPAYVNLDTQGGYSLNNLPSLTSQLQLNFDGTGAWNAFKPTKSQMGLSQLLLEAHDLPSLIKFNNIRKGLDFFRNLGSNYLKYEFGWKPFLKDVKDLTLQTVNFDKRLRQLARDNGRVVRRGGTYGTPIKTTETNTTNTYYTYPVLRSSLWAGTHQYSKTIGVEENKWFSGAFKYFINPVHGKEMTYKDKEQLFRIIYGLDLTPSTVWNVMPWSWMGDWFANIGDNLESLNDSQDNLVGIYAYIMHKKVTTVTHVVRGRYYQGASPQPFEARAVQVTSLKERNAASSFGFGINTSDFSPKQAAIAAALAFQRS